MRSDARYAYCFLAILSTSPITILFTNYLLLWITSFVETCQVESMLQAKVIYQAVLLIAFSVTVMSMPVLGIFVDNLPANIFVPASFLGRGLILIGFLMLKTPDSWFANLICALILFSSAAEKISVEAMFYKSIPLDIRGAMIGLLNFWGFIGMIIVTVLSGPAFDIVGASAPFAIVLVLDLIVFLAGVYLVYSGKLKQ